MGFLIISDEQKLPKTDDVYEINNSEDINHIKKLLLREEDLILRVIVLGKGKTTARIKKIGTDFVKIIVDNAPPFVSLSIRFGIVAFFFFLFLIFF